MLERTFQLIPGVGPWREKDLWARGIARWDDFPGPDGIGISARVDDAARGRLLEARQALAAKDLGALAAMLPAREHWRLYPHFASEAVFLDIEADGPPGRQTPTVVGLLDDDGPRTFIADRNLDELPAALRRRRIWVTFNGSCHDLPVLQAWFEDFPRPVVHIDLRHLCRKVRLHGGLKDIEDQVGLARPPHLRGVNGWDAIVLWRAWKETRDKGALRFLVEYNLYDAINLKSLIAIAYNRAAEGLHCDETRVEVFDRGEVLYDISRLVLAL